MHQGSISRSSPMVHVVFLILASGFLIMLCDAACSGSQPRRLSRGQILTGCMDEDNDIMREFNSTWFTEKCDQCTCFSDGSINCCTGVNRPVPEEPGCVAVFNQTTCSYTMQRTDNSTASCSIRGVM